MKNLSLLFVLSIFCCLSCNNEKKKTEVIKPPIATEFCLDTLVLDIWIDTITNKIIIADDVINFLTDPCDEEDIRNRSVLKEKIILSPKSEQMLRQQLKTDYTMGFRKMSVANLKLDENLRTIMVAQNIDTVCYKVHRKIPAGKKEDGIIYEISHQADKGLCVKESPKTTGAFDCYEIDKHELNLEMSSLELVSLFGRTCYQLDNTSPVYLKVKDGDWCIIGKKVDCL